MNRIAIALCFVLASCQPPHKPSTSMNKQTLLQANDALYAGLNEMFIGNLEPLEALWSHSDSISYMGPFGGYLRGWEAVHKDFQAVTDMKIGGKLSCELLGSNVSGTMGYISCVEVGENIDPNGQAVAVRHRATNIFQWENDQWRLVHHHTDISNQLETAFDKSE